STAPKWCRTPSGTSGCCMPCRVQWCARCARHENRTMNATTSSSRPITLLLCALGGEGGGVLTEWLIEAARHAGHAAQSTSIPGVAQRTGATTYYVEVFPVPLARLGGRRPVFSLTPAAGTLDAVVSSELMETVRQIGHGMADAERTCVITSTGRS